MKMKPELTLPDLITTKPLAVNNDTQTFFGLSYIELFFVN